MGKEEGWRRQGGGRGHGRGRLCGWRAWVGGGRGRGCGGGRVATLQADGVSGGHGRGEEEGW